MLRGTDCAAGRICGVYILLWGICGVFCTAPHVLSGFCGVASVHVLVLQVYAVHDKSISSYFEVQFLERPAQDKVLQEFMWGLLCMPHISTGVLRKNINRTTSCKGLWSGLCRVNQVLRMCIVQDNVCGNFCEASFTGQSPVGLLWGFLWRGD